MYDNKFDLFIVLNNYAAEGCPRLALNLIDNFKKRDLKIMLLTFNQDNSDLLEEFRKREITVKSLNLRTKGYTKYLRILYLIFIFSRKYRPYSILSFPFGWHSLIAIAAKVSGVKNVCTHAGNLAPKFGANNFWKLNFLVQLGRPFTNKIICCSKYVERSIIDSFYLNNSEVTNIYNCYDQELFAFKDDSKQKIKKAYLEKKIVLCMVARLEIHKDQETLIKAVKILKDNDFEIKLLLIGDGSQRHFLEELTENLNLNNDVLFLGAVNNVYKKLDKADIFVFSTTEDEGFGIALAEAMGRGIPIIASNVGACNEILRNGDFGLLFRPRSPLSISKSIEAVLKNQSITSKKIIAASKYAQNNFSKEKMSNLYFEELF